MDIITRLRRRIAPRTYSAGAATDATSRMTPEQVQRMVRDRERGTPYAHPEKWTKETEYEWAEQVYVGKIARNLIALAKNCMAATLTSDDPPIRRMCQDMSRRTHLLAKLQQIRLYWDKYGQVYILPIYTDKTRHDIAKIKLLHPPTVTVYRNTKAEIAAMNERLRTAKLPIIAAKPGSGDDIIGYLQTANDQTWHFAPADLIFIPRYPDGQRPNGYSLLVQAADIISAKLQIEVDQVIMAARHGDPKHVFGIPPSWWDPQNVQKLKQIKEEFREGMRAGQDFFLSQNPDNPDENVTVSLLQATGNPQAVIKAQDHTENQFVATFGLADSFTESESSNRSVGEVQLAFFERDIAADRIMFAEILEDQLFGPWLQANGYDPGAAWLEFADLTPDDRLTKLQIMAPLFPYLDQDIVDQVLEQAGYTITPGDRPAPTQGAAIMRRYGIHAEYSRLRGIPRTEAQLIRDARDAITDNLAAYRKAAAEAAKK